MMNNQFIIASCIMLVGGCWLGGCYCFSANRKSRLASLAQLQKKAEKVNAKAQVKDRYILKYRLAILADCVAILLIIILTGSSICWVGANRQDYELSLLEGRLYPADEPIPPNACSDKAEQLSLFDLTNLSQDGLFILAGDNASYATKFPFVVIEVGGKRRFVIDRDNEGRILPSLDVLSADGRVIVRIQNGNFTINVNNILPGKMRPDRHTLVVTDEFGRDALKMRYLNKRTISVDAFLQYPEWPEPIVLSGSHMKGVTPVTRNCTINAGIISINDPKDMNSIERPRVDR